MDGVVVETNVTVGELISPTVPVSLVRLVDDRRRKVRAEVDERDLGHLCSQQEAIVTAEGFPGAALAAQLERVNLKMGRRSILTADPAEKSDRDMLEVILTLSDDIQTLPIGLRVGVLFGTCRDADARANLQTKK